MFCDPICWFACKILGTLSYIDSLWFSFVAFAKHHLTGEHAVHPDRWDPIWPCLIRSCLEFIVGLKTMNCIIIPACLKYADNILYGYAKPVSIAPSAEIHPRFPKTDSHCWPPEKNIYIWNTKYAVVGACFSPKQCGALRGSHGKGKPGMHIIYIYILLYINIHAIIYNHCIYIYIYNYVWCPYSLYLRVRQVAAPTRFSPWCSRLSIIRKCLPQWCSRESHWLPPPLWLMAVAEKIKILHRHVLLDCWTGET